jgi:hypothetical protein
VPANIRSWREVLGRRSGRQQQLRAAQLALVWRVPHYKSGEELDRLIKAAAKKP